VSDRGSIVIGWLTKLVILFAVLGFLAYDGVALITSNYDAADDATTAASAAADEYRATKSVQAAYDAAVKAVDGKGDTVETRTFQVEQGGQVTLTIDRHPKTLWLHRIGPLKKWTLVHQSGTGSPAS
jgi:Flp pilus assembly protein TadG